MNIHGLSVELYLSRKLVHDIIIDNNLTAGYQDIWNQTNPDLINLKYPSTGLFTSLFYFQTDSSINYMS